MGMDGCLQFGDWAPPHYDYKEHDTVRAVLWHVACRERFIQISAVAGIFRPNLVLPDSLLPFPLKHVTLRIHLR